jgi:hypothetical protein
MFGATTQNLVAVVTRRPEICTYLSYANCRPMAFGAKVFPLVKAVISNHLLLLSVFYLKTLPHIYLSLGK